jgi:hypothetical protein
VGQIRKNCNRKKERKNEKGWGTRTPGIKGKYLKYFRLRTVQAVVDKEFESFAVVRQVGFPAFSAEIMSFPF